MALFIVTEALHGEGYENKLAILRTARSREKALKERERIIRTRLGSKLFGDWFDKNSLQRDIEVWQKVE